MLTKVLIATHESWRFPIMRILIAIEFVSLDGVMQAPGMVVYGTTPNQQPSR